MEEVAFEDACGLILVQAVCSQVDSPPFDKSMVDGYAISIRDMAPTLRVAEQVTAGQVPHHAVQPGTTIRVMTGAPLPDGADAVVKWEDTTQLDDATICSPVAAAADAAARCQPKTDRPSKSGGPIEPGYCVSPQGSAFHAGQQVLAADTRLGPAAIGLLAEIGRYQVPVIPRPRVAVLPTGNELVEGKSSPTSGPLSAGKIRNSNGPMLLAALRQLGIETVNLGIGRDNPQDLQARIELGLDTDVLLISGGVSAGVLDLVPGVLKSLGVRQVLHKVRMKPGKPVWFGVRESAARRVLVFGLPGNPVSTFVAFQLFVRPTLQALAGEPFAPQQPMACRLTGPMAHRGDRPSYQPCKIVAAPPTDRSREGGCPGDLATVGLPAVQPLAWRGSADLATLAQANGLAQLPPGDYQLDGGREIHVLPL